jgi:hypothetical protein
LSSTNGTHATGDGQKMLMEIGANRHRHGQGPGPPHWSR